MTAMAKKQKKKAPLVSKILYAVAIVFLVLAVAATGASQYFSGVLDTYIGVGKPIVTTKAEKGFFHVNILFPLP